jgi:prenyltransferase beta subunit
VLAVARILNLLTPELVSGCVEYILRCQTYEGGFGGEPGNEAHGGYNYCGVASLLILRACRRCDLRGLEHWLLQRQMKLEGGFQGRTNKLVDSCYSFWQGAALAMVEVVRRGGDDLYDMEMYLQATAASSLPSAVDREEEEVEEEEVVEVEGTRLQVVSDLGGCLPFNQRALQRYILHCAQNTEVRLPLCVRVCAVIHCIH